MHAGPSGDGASPGAPVVVHTLGTQCLCNFDIISHRGHGKLYYNTLVTPHERDLPCLCSIGTVFMGFAQCAPSPPPQNKSAIMTLSRQVQGLKLSQYGKLQSHTQNVTLGAGNLPTATAPLAFAVNNFYDQMVFRGTIINQGGLNLATYQNTQSFARPSSDFCCN